MVGIFWQGGAAPWNLDSCFSAAAVLASALFSVPDWWAIVNIQHMLGLVFTVCDVNVHGYMSRVTVLCA